MKADIIPEHWKFAIPGTRLETFLRMITEHTSFKTKIGKCGLDSGSCHAVGYGVELRVIAEELTFDNDFRRKNKHSASSNGADGCAAVWRRNVARFADLKIILAWDSKGSLGRRGQNQAQEPEDEGPCA